MGDFASLLYGFSICLSPGNLFFCFIGVLLGTLVGVLPGIGPVGAISILLPATFHMQPIGAIIMLSGVYYGSMYGGSTTSILVRIPGEASSVVTCLDGYEMARKGRAGPALGMAAFGSFIAGTLGLIGLMFLSVPLAAFALRFGPPEYFAVVLLGLTTITYLTHGSKMKGFIMGIFGLILSSVGIDPIEGSARLSFDLLELWDGIDLVPLAMGLFGISEILLNSEEFVRPSVIKSKIKIKSLFPTLADWVQAKGAILRGSILGFFLGVLPGGGAVISSFVSYGIEKKISKEPEKFGKGAIEGLVGPESANNSATAGAFIPLFTLGIPANVVMALLFGAFVIHGLRPGPFLIQDHPDLFWGVVSSMYVGNVMLLLLNLPLIPLWVQILKVPAVVLNPIVLVVCMVGAFSLKNSVFDMLLMTIFGILGYLLRKFEFEIAPLILAFVLGPILESNLRQSLLLSQGDMSIFLTRPISAITMALVLVILLNSLFPVLKRVLRSKKPKE